MVNFNCSCLYSTIFTLSSCPWSYSQFFISWLLPGNLAQEPQHTFLHNYCIWIFHLNRLLVFELLSLMISKKSILLMTACGNIVNLLTTKTSVVKILQKRWLILLNQRKKYRTLRKLLNSWHHCLTLIKFNNANITFIFCNI